MSERWRRPAKIIGVEHSDHGVLLRDAVGFRAPIQKIVDDETLARYRIGQLCFHCDEPQESPWPVHCSLCQYPMRECQANDIRLDFEGRVNVGPTTSINDEIARMRERKARAQYNPDGDAA